MRTFIAIPLPESIIEHTFDIRNKLDILTTDVKWVEKENYHITLKFLGETNRDIINNIYVYLDMITKDMPIIKLKTSQISFFPNYKRPRVIWLGVDGELDKANNLGERIDYFLTEEGYAEERKRDFHITLGRIKTDNSQKSLIDKMLNINNEIINKNFIVDRLNFMESQLTPKGPIYNIHKSFKFRG